MKRILAILLTLSAVISLHGCGRDNAPDSAENTTDASETGFEETESDFRTTNISTSDEQVKPQLLTEIIDNAVRPELEKVTFQFSGSESAARTASIDDLYNINVLHSNVVGLVGSPVSVSFDRNEIKKGILTFYYNKDELRGIPEKNLIILKFNDDDQRYDILRNFTLDTDSCFVSILVKEPGDYMLADAYKWFETWGMNTDGFEYQSDKSEYISDWERECATGDIMKIADKEWAKKNAPDFNVSDPAQLASAVYFINTDTSSDSYTITFENDIDISEFEWAPMGWSKQPFKGIINGNDHTLNGLKINNSNESFSGFIGHGVYYTAISGLNITNAEINGGTYSGIIGGELYADEIINVNVSGNIITNGSNYGTIAGLDNSSTYYENCSADVSINGEKFNYFSSTQKIKDETPINEAFTIYVDENLNVIRNTVDGYDDLGWHVECNGKTILERNAENELMLDSHWTVERQPGKYTVYLNSFINGTYIRVSNIVSFESE